MQPDLKTYDTLIAFGGKVVSFKYSRSRAIKSFVAVLQPGSDIWQRKTDPRIILFDIFMDTLTCKPTPEMSPHAHITLHMQPDCGRTSPLMQIASDKDKCL